MGHISNIVNMVKLARWSVEYESAPRINGIIMLHNEGRIRLGSGVTFNCSRKSNYVGLTKPCSIFVGKGAEVLIGDNSGMSGVSLFASCRIQIGRNVLIGGNTWIWDTDFHPLDSRDRRTNDKSKIAILPVEIEDDAFIGANVIICKGVSVGTKSIIGAGSVVTKSVPPLQVWAGNPARYIRPAS
jgi:acetyltransferase-like isoleucine patch superfamily enzyme